MNIGFVVMVVGISLRNPVVAIIGAVMWYVLANKKKDRDKNPETDPKEQEDDVQ